MTRRTLTLIAALAWIASPETTHAQLGRFGRGKDKPDSATAAKARADSIARAGTDTAAAAPAPEAKKSRFGLGRLASTVTSTVVGSIASVWGRLMTGSTADLSTVVPLVYRNANTWPKSLGTLGTKIIPNWGDGGDLVTISFTQRTGAMMSKIDGTVTVDGKPADYATMGVYSSMVPTKTGTRRVEVTTTSGQKAGFTIPARELEGHEHQRPGKSDDARSDEGRHNPTRRGDRG